MSDQFGYDLELLGYTTFEQAKEKRGHFEDIYLVRGWYVCVLGRAEPFIQPKSRRGLGTYLPREEATLVYSGAGHPNRRKLASQEVR